MLFDVLLRLAFCPVQVSSKYQRERQLIAKEPISNLIFDLVNGVSDFEVL
jgi:hypothetical protein